MTRVKPKCRHLHFALPPRGNMHATAENTRGVVEFIFCFWSVLSVGAARTHALKADGCGHTAMGTESGTVASRNYPGTYPNGTQCRWRLQVPQGHTLHLLFGDFNLEESPDCKQGSLTISAQNGTTLWGPLCGNLIPSQKTVVLNSSEVIIHFLSGLHRSGRGFLLSYTTDQHPDLISCLHRGTHSSTQRFSAYCPAGCDGVTGDIWGHSEQGYRDTSVICKAAIHAGVLSDGLGGVVTVMPGRSITLYDSALANGILSKTGPLSDKKLLFSKACNDELTVSAVNASSFRVSVDGMGRRVLWSQRDGDLGGQLLPQATNGNDPEHWLELELAERSNVTGIITQGLPGFYIESYSLLFSKDQRSWKLYRSAISKEKKVFQAHADGHLRVLNSLVPPVSARFLRLQPLSWHARPTAQVQVLGCRLFRPRSNGGTSFAKIFPTVKLFTNPNSTKEPAIIKDPLQSSSQVVMVVVGVVLGLFLCAGSLLAGVWWKRRKKATTVKTSALATAGGQSYQEKSLPYAESVLISYPLERAAHGSQPPLNDYAEPDVMAGGGHKLDSTFRPAPNEGYTVPLILNHYDTPGKLPEYTEPLPVEPEYATPFSDQRPEASLATPTQHISRQTLPPTHGPRAPVLQSQYDSPAQRGATSEYSVPSAPPDSRLSADYAEPQAVDPLLQHTYHQPL